MHDLPIIRLEIESLKRSISHMMSVSNNELDDLVKQSLERTLNAEWIIEEVDAAVNKVIKESINNLTNNYKLRSVIEDAMAMSIIEKFKDVKVKNSTKKLSINS